MCIVYRYIYNIYYSNNNRYACDIIFFFFLTALSLDIKTILLGIERKTRTYNNINVAIETYGVHLEPFEYNIHTCLTAVVSAYCIILYLCTPYSVWHIWTYLYYHRDVGPYIQYNIICRIMNLIILNILLWHFEQKARYG